ncbi:hypothetical protein [Burkholderia gladioli]|uniref:hypothetical protein n=1 Tax=Burkholderia gladioli TaxID=28095 RepID=UPI001641D19A|nr:hypothetical protein [Burkholderia gladioli]
MTSLGNATNRTLLIYVGGDAAMNLSRASTGQELVSASGQTIALLGTISPASVLATAPAAATTTLGKIAIDIQSGNAPSIGDLISIAGNVMSIVGATASYVPAAQGIASFALVSGKLISTAGLLIDAPDFGRAVFNILNPGNDNESLSDAETIRDVISTGQAGEGSIFDANGNVIGSRTTDGTTTTDRYISQDGERVTTTDYGNGETSTLTIHKDGTSDSLLIESSATGTYYRKITSLSKDSDEIEVGFLDIHGNYIRRTIYLDDSTTHIVYTDGIPELSTTTTIPSIGTRKEQIFSFKEKSFTEKLYENDNLILKTKNGILRFTSEESEMGYTHQKHYAKSGLIEMEIKIYHSGKTEILNYRDGTLESLDEISSASSKHTAYTPAGDPSYFVEKINNTKVVEIYYKNGKIEHEYFNNDGLITSQEYWLEKSDHLNYENPSTATDELPNLTTPNRGMTSISHGMLNAQTPDLSKTQLTHQPNGANKPNSITISDLLLQPSDTEITSALLNLTNASDSAPKPPNPINLHHESANKNSDDLKILETEFFDEKQNVNGYLTADFNTTRHLLDEQQLDQLL